MQKCYFQDDKIQGPCVFFFMATFDNLALWAFNKLQNNMII